MTLESDSETVLPALAPRSASHVAPISLYEVRPKPAGKLFFRCCRCLQRDELIRLPLLLPLLLMILFVGGVCSEDGVCSVSPRAHIGARPNCEKHDSPGANGDRGVFLCRL